MLTSTSLALFLLLTISITYSLWLIVLRGGVVLFPSPTSPQKPSCKLLSLAGLPFFEFLLTLATTDWGAQFESALFQSVNVLLGIKRIHITAYHPCANGLVERFHRQLKASLEAQREPPSGWTEALPFILLSIRYTIKSDIDCCPAQLVFGTTLRLHSQFLDSPSSLDPLLYADRLRDFMQQLQPVASSSEH